MHCTSLWYGILDTMRHPFTPKKLFHQKMIILPHVSHINEQFNEHFIILLMKHNLYYNSNIMHPYAATYSFHYGPFACMFGMFGMLYAVCCMAIVPQCTHEQLFIYDTSECFKWFLMQRLMSSERKFRNRIHHCF